MAPAVLKEFGIKVQAAAGGRMAETIRLPGEVVYNADGVTRVSPTVAGIVKKVNISVGDDVRAGEVMAILNSREVAAARNNYLANRARLRLAQENLKRDRRLLEDKIGSERAFLESRQALREAEIALQQAESTLHALGYSHEQIEQVRAIGENKFNLYSLKAPISGTVTQRHLTLGERIAPDSPAPFVVADLSSVWVNLTVYQRDLPHVRAGQPVRIRFGHGIPETKGLIDFVSPALNESTRTAYARVVVKNPAGNWRPGMFVEGLLETGHDPARVLVPRSAIISLDEQPVIFVRTDSGFKPRPVKLGRTTEERAEILAGLNPGDRYAATNVLTLKAEYNSAALEHAGHAH
ncbi:MAG: efflux RND transporter periplasmic adaptor subunit [Lentisphaeria bacterium]